MLYDDEITITRQTITTIYNFAGGYRAHRLPLLARDIDSATIEFGRVKSIQWFSPGRPDPLARVPGSGSGSLFFRRSPGVAAGFCFTSAATFAGSAAFTTAGNFLIRFQQPQPLSWMDRRVVVDLVPARKLLVVEAVTPRDRIKRVAGFNRIPAGTPRCGVP